MLCIKNLYGPDLQLIEIVLILRWISVTATRAMSCLANWLKHSAGSLRQSDTETITLISTIVVNLHTVVMFRYTYINRQYVMFRDLKENRLAVGM